MSTTYLRAPLFDGEIEVTPAYSEGGEDFPAGTMSTRGAGINPGDGLQLYKVIAPARCAAVDVAASTALVVWPNMGRVSVPRGWVDIELSVFRTEFETATGRQPTVNEE